MHKSQVSNTCLTNIHLFVSLYKSKITITYLNNWLYLYSHISHCRTFQYFLNKPNFKIIFAITVCNTDKIEKFLGKKQLSKLAQEEIGYLNSPITIK